MARPRKDGMDYFPHDTDAVNDTKIEALRMLYGNDGYAFYFILLELIYRQPNFELDVSDAETIQILAKKVEVSPEKFGNMLNTAIKRECFDSASYVERGVLTSGGVKKRSKVVVEKREKMRKKSNDGAEKELLPDSCIVSDAETGEESTQSKSKSKVKDKSNSSKNNSAEPVVQHEGYHVDFESFWTVYPKFRRKDKAKTFGIWKKKIKESERDLLIQCTERYAADKKTIGATGQFAKMPSTYLNAGTYKDYLSGGDENETIQSSTGSTGKYSEFTIE
ncbi:DUF4373 domain-containing protein [Paenibacillus xylanexedens]|uniref:Lin1244/Lin1753-like N-terminal domain-containing protein n=1 Tax=Paenibacillus xylanexedens TaxID=528191 RepID=A0ABS4RSL1_PAEXY|nr:DUF4373 domain-containing protein [Paenibacillus xylanexedens]MBP2245325.1 hypothetical protein [Paenibacillus xylanexedens]